MVAVSSGRLVLLCFLGWLPARWLLRRWWREAVPQHRQLRSASQPSTASSIPMDQDDVLTELTVRTCEMISGVSEIITQFSLPTAGANGPLGL